MAFVHGKSTAFKLDNAAGSIIDLSAFLEDVGFPRNIETNETTTFGKNSKTYIAGLADGTISLSGKWDSTPDTQLAAILAAHMAGTTLTVSFEYGPVGSGSGALKYLGEAILTSYEVSSPVADVVTFSAELQITGDVTRSTFA